MYANALRYEIEYESDWTRYTLLGTYSNVEACERECESRYDVVGLKFNRNENGILMAKIASEENVTLKLIEYEAVEYHAS